MRRAVCLLHSCRKTFLFIHMSPVLLHHSKYCFLIDHHCKLPVKNLWYLSFSRYEFLSDYLTDLKLHSTKKMCQKLPSLGFELITSGSSVQYSAHWAREESVGDFCSELSFVSCTTSHVGLCLFLESIEHGFIKALMIHIDNQIVT